MKKFTLTGLHLKQFTLKGFGGKIIISTLLITLFNVVILAICGGYLFYSETTDKTDLTSNQTIHNNLVDMVKKTDQASVENYLKAVSEQNLATIKFVYNEYKTGKISEETAKQRASDLLLNSKIGKSGYTYCVDSNGFIRVHPKAALINADLNKYDFIQTQKKVKSGYIEYLWKNPGEEVERKKALYMTYFPEWDWIVSCSSYKEEFNQLVPFEEIGKLVSANKAGKTGYSYIIDYSGTLLVHPASQGKNIIDSVDDNGKYFIKDLLKARNGTINYFWKNENDITAREKVVFFNDIEQRGLILATGIYTEEIQNLKSFPYTLGVIALVLFAISAFVVIVMSKKLMKTPNLIISKIVNLSKHLSATSSQISQGSKQLEEGSIQQAASIEETSVTMDETVSIVKENTRNTRDAFILSEKTTNSANDGFAKMSEMKTSMEEIKKSSDDISKIIKVIETIAFQTNILALNAAVEAARAGESGAGFAVVAEEVRNLAGRSSNAAKDTSAIIDNNIQLSRKGVDISNLVSNSLKEIKDNAHEVSNLVSKISATSEDQVRGTEQIAKAINQMEHVTQENAVLAEKSSSSSNEIEQQIYELNMIVSELYEFAKGESNIEESNV